MPRRRPPDALRGAGRPLCPQNAFSAVPIFFLANRPGFCDKFGSSEMLCVRTCSFLFCVLKSSPRERGVVLTENQQLSTEERDLRDAPTMGAAPCLVFFGGACWSLCQGMGLVSRPLSNLRGTGFMPPPQEHAQ